MQQVTKQFEAAVELCLHILIAEGNGVEPSPEELKAFFTERFPDLCRSNKQALAELGLEEEIGSYCREKGIEIQ